MQVSAREEVLLEAFRRLPPDAAAELSALTQRLAALAPDTTIDWSDSWSDADLQEFTVACDAPLRTKHNEHVDMCEMEIRNIRRRLIVLRTRRRAVAHAIDAVRRLAETPSRPHQLILVEKRQDRPQAKDKNEALPSVRARCAPPAKGTPLRRADSPEKRAISRPSIPDLGLFDGSADVIRRIVTGVPAAEIYPRPSLPSRDRQGAVFTHQKWPGQ